MKEFKKIFDAHRISYQRKVFTKTLIKSIKKPVDKIKVGELYCINYIDNSFPTDKWHQLSIVFVTEIYNQTIEGFNILYFDRDLIYKILSKAVESKDYKKSKIKLLIDQELGIVPYICAKKSFFASKIKLCSLIDRTDWPIVPNIDKEQFGNLNSLLLTNAWNEEQIKYIKNKPKKKIQNQKEILDDTVEV